MSSYYKPQIAQCIYLPNSECVAILKTFWIRIVQRTWKKVFKQRKEVLRQRTSLLALKKQEQVFRDSHFIVPSLVGMLSGMRKTI
jgi:hypothetical protein